MSNSNPVCDECGKRHDVHNMCKTEDIANDYIPTPQRVQEFVVHGALPGMNEYTSANRTHWSRGAKLKKETELTVMEWIKAFRIKPIRPAQFHFHYVEKENKNGKQRDPDNIASCKKFILDAMQKMGVLKDDSMKYILGWSESWEVTSDKNEVGVRITIKEM